MVMAELPAVGSRATREIPVRRLDFDFDPDAVPANWYAGDPFLSLFWDSLSLLFPEGERFFVESVKHYRDRIDDPDLRANVVAFAGQEAMHGKGHRAFNDMLRAQGLLIATPLEDDLRVLLKTVRRRLPPKAQLAVTCALEHFTAILAEQLLSIASHRDAIDPSIRRLWLWHALEESEHKAVAYDVYRAVGGRYPLRVAVMLLTTVVFVAEVLNVHIRFLAAKKRLFDVRGWTKGLAYAVGSPGLLRRLIPAYLDYFRPSFHPNDRDTGALLTEWRETLFAN